MVGWIGWLRAKTAFGIFCPGEGLQEAAWASDDPEAQRVPALSASLSRELNVLGPVSEVPALPVAGAEPLNVEASLGAPGVLTRIVARRAEAKGDGIIELVEGDDLLRSLSAWRVEPLGAEGRDLDFLISGNEEGVASLDELNGDARRVWVAQAAEPVLA